MLSNLINKNTIYKYLADGTNLSFITIGTIIFVTFLIAIYIFAVYKLINKNAFYSKEFNNILPGMNLITAIITITMHSSVIVFIGIIGTLSLIRFRHAFKNPLDLLYLFWSLCTGIFCGTQLYTIALLTAIFMTLLFLWLDSIVFTPTSYVLTITSFDDTYDQIFKLLQPYCKKLTKQEITRYSSQIVYTFTFETKKEDLFLDKLAKIPSLLSLSFTSYNGEYRGN